MNLSFSTSISSSVILHFGQTAGELNGVVLVFVCCHVVRLPLFYIPAMSATRFLFCRLQNSLPPAVIMYAILPLQDVSFSVNIYRTHISMLYRLVSSLRLAVPAYIEVYISPTLIPVCVCE